MQNNNTTPCKISEIGSQIPLPPLQRKNSHPVQFFSSTSLTRNSFEPRNAWNLLINRPSETKILFDLGGNSRLAKYEEVQFDYHHSANMSRYTFSESMSVVDSARNLGTVLKPLQWVLQIRELKIREFFLIWLKISKMTNKGILNIV